MGTLNSDKRQQMLIDLIKGNKNTDIQNQLSVIKREKIEKPIIYVGAGTCGLGAGAAETIDAIKNYLIKNKIDADIMEVGCIGLCSAEPLVDVQLPGRTRVCFQRVSAEMVDGLLDAMFREQMPEPATAGA